MAASNPDDAVAKLAGPVSIVVGYYVLGRELRTCCRAGREGHGRGRDQPDHDRGPGTLSARGVDSGRNTVWGPVVHTWPSSAL